MDDAAKGRPGAVMVLDPETPVRRPGSPAPAPGRWRRSLILLGLLGLLALLLPIVFWRWQGIQGLVGSLIGLALGGGIGAAGRLLRKKAWTATGPKLVSVMMASVGASFGLFVGSAVILALFWRDGALAALLTALAVYLTISFHEAFLASFREEKK